MTIDTRENGPGPETAARAVVALVRRRIEAGDGLDGLELAVAAVLGDRFRALPERHAEAAGIARVVGEAGAMVIRLLSAYMLADGRGYAGAVETVAARLAAPLEAHDYEQAREADSRWREQIRSGAPADAAPALEPAPELGGAARDLLEYLADWTPPGEPVTVDEQIHADTVLRIGARARVVLGRGRPGDVGC